MNDRAQSSPEAGRVLHGVGVSPGVAIGPAHVVSDVTIHVPSRVIKESEVRGEIARFEKALIATRSQIREIVKNLGGGTGETGVLDAHLMVLDDRMLIDDVVRGIHDGLQNAEAVVKSVCDRHAEALSAIEDEYIRERVADIRDIGRRLLRNLSGQQPVSEEVGHEHIVIARDLAPSETAALRKDLAVGLAIDMGSPTSHTAVMARAMDIPAVVAMRDVSEQVKQGDEVLIDGNRGVLIVRPTPRQLEEYGRLAETRRSIAKELPALRELPAETMDGHRITLSANIEGVDEVDSVTAHGAEGVGLFRSEYLHLLSSAPVTEEDQNRVYCEVARRLSPQPVIIRTLDIGGDKLMTGAPFLPEPNPFLGCRSIRLSFLHPDYFKAQLRAILRASRYKNVKLMYPMISGVEEVEQANAILSEAMDDLDRAGEEFDRNIDIGAMVEIPSAALTADTIAEHVDFLSIGTNDLVQYTLAVDRVNERVAYLYQPTHPAVLNLIRETIRAGKRNGIWVGLCGEMAADPVLTPLLVGLDLDELSVSPPAAPLVKAVIRRLKFEEARAFADEAVECSSAGEVVRRARELMRRVAPEILELV